MNAVHNSQIVICPTSTSILFAVVRHYTCDTGLICLTAPESHRKLKTKVLRTTAKWYLNCGFGNNLRTHSWGTIPRHPKQQYRKKKKLPVLVISRRAASRRRCAVNRLPFHRQRSADRPTVHKLQGFRRGGVWGAESPEGKGLRAPQPFNNSG